MKRGGGREWPYYNGKNHRIVIEQYLECEDGDLPDYKFYCFNGVCECFYVRKGYAIEHENGRTAFFNASKEKIPVSLDYSYSDQSDVNLPETIDEMILLSQKLSRQFPHCRVDFYNVDGRIVFGEMTFFNASGYFNFTPDSFDIELGEKFVLPNKK